ncbi:Uncharacterised protein [uncultured archaeon]|nr:Uncharacterised protein [uncultured archaeon]
MQEYLIVFQAHVDRLRSPENFPTSVLIKETVFAESEEQLKHIYNAKFSLHVASPGLAVWIDPDRVDASRITFNQKIFVPWHMITYFHGDVHPITPLQPKDKSLTGEPMPEDSKKKETVQ